MKNETTPDTPPLAPEVAALVAELREYHAYLVRHGWAASNLVSQAADALEAQGEDRQTWATQEMEWRAAWLQTIEQAARNTEALREAGNRMRNLLDTPGTRPIDNEDAHARAAIAAWDALTAAGAESEAPAYTCCGQEVTTALHYCPRCGRKAKVTP